MGKIPAGTTIVSGTGTSVVLSNSVVSGSSIEFSLPSRVTPPADFTDGKGNGVDATFVSNSAVFTLSDLGQPIVETDGGLNIPNDTVILTLTDATTVTLSNNVANASNIHFRLPSRLAAFASFHDGNTTLGSTTFTSNTAAFNQADVGRPVIETDGGSNFEPGTVILSVSNDSLSATLSHVATGTGTNFGFALPARNASNIALQGDNKTGIVAYYAMSLATPPTNTVQVDVTTTDGNAVLTSNDSRFATTQAPVGTTAGNYTVTFAAGDTGPVVIGVTAANLFAPFDPHNEFITHTVDQAATLAAEYLTAPTTPPTPPISAPPMFFLIYSNREANSIVQAPANMVVTKCGDINPCDRPGPGSSYVLRLTESPASPTTPVNVAFITDGQTDITPGGRITNTQIGNQTTTPLFTGTITFTPGGTSLMRSGGSALGSFLNNGFQAGQIVTITGQSVNFTIFTVNDTTMTFAGPLAAGPSSVTISRVTNHGQFTGILNYNDCALHDPAGNCLGTLTRPDNASWLDDGFLEGQLFCINPTSLMPPTCPGSLFKIQALTGDHVQTLVVTAAVHDPVNGGETVQGLPFLAPSGTTSTVTLKQWAAETTFDQVNWSVPLGVPVLADPFYNVPSSNANRLEFPKVPHLLSAIRGPLSVEGADPGNDHTQLQFPVMLPNEKNAPPFGIGVQPPESQQVNVLNIFDDGSQQDQHGVVNSTSVTGFGMGPGLDFTGHKGYVPGDPTRPTFGEPAKFPGGISFGSITIDPATGNFLTNASLSTVQVLNLMAGQGNDHVTVTGSLVPGLYANPDGSLTTTVNGVTTLNTFVHGGLTMVQGGGAAQLSVIGGTFDTTATTIKRADNLNWGDYEFAAGQELLWNGVPFGMITGGASTSTLTVAGAPPMIGAGVTGTISVFDPAIKSMSSFVFAGHNITRADLRSWAEFGFAVGQAITVDGVPAGTVTGLSGPTNDVLTVTGSPISGATVAVYDAINPNAIRLGGNFITVSAGGGPGPGLAPPSLTGAFTEAITGTATETLTRSSGSWLADGFVYGMVLQIAGVPAWTITGVSAATLDLTGPNGMPTLANAQLIGFAPSPLVVYGSTSQDGIWYSGDPHTLSQRDFGSKPFPTQLGNGTPDFIFPVADPFKFAGNNVLDASADFPNASLPSGSVPNVGVPEGQVPSVGVILYGGPGNNTIYGSQAPDFIAGGSGNTTVYGERGDNQILGSDGINVDIITRTLSFPTANTSVYPNADVLLCGQTPTPTCNNLIYGNTPGAGEVVTDRFADYNNVIFGADGIVIQDTKEATVGVLGTSRPVTGLTLVSNVSTGKATLTCPTIAACFGSGDVGQLISDSSGFLGAGTTIVSVNIGGTVATLSRNALNGATTNGLTVQIFVKRTVTATLTSNAATLNNALPPNTTSSVATLTCATACFNQTDVGLNVADAGNVYISDGTVIVAVNVTGTVATLSRNAVGNVNVAGLPVVVGPPHGYCRPTGSTSNTPYCGPSGTTPFGDARVEK